MWLLQFELKRCAQACSAVALWCIRTPWRQKEGGRTHNDEGTEGSSAPTSQWLDDITYRQSERTDTQMQRDDSWRRHELNAVIETKNSSEGAHGCHEDRQEERSPNNQCTQRLSAPMSKWLAWHHSQMKWNWGVDADVKMTRCRRMQLPAISC